MLKGRQVQQPLLGWFRDLSTVEADGCYYQLPQPHRCLRHFLKCELFEDETSSEQVEPALSLVSSFAFVR
jgi:hypothetical protein